MAGLYADVPGPRIEYDRDGSTGFTRDASNNITVLTGGQLANMNDEDGDSVAFVANGSIGVIFPVAMTIQGCFHALSNANTVTTQVSTNTTNGVDGTWTTFRSAVGNTSISPTYRSGIFVPGAPATNVKGIRWGGTGGNNAVCLHIYGYPETNTDRLEFWHPTLDQPLRNTPAYFDYGDVSRGAAIIERDFRLKNLSTTLTADTITVGCEAPTDTSPTYVSQTQFRYNGGAYGSTASLASLAPDTISNVFTAKLDVSATATISTWTQRYYAQAASWS